MQQLNTHCDKFALDHLSGSQQLSHGTAAACRYSRRPLRHKPTSKHPALTDYSSGHAINKNAWKDAKRRTPPKLTSASG